MATQVRGTFSTSSASRHPSHETDTVGGFKVHARRGCGASQVNHGTKCTQKAGQKRALSSPAHREVRFILSSFRSLRVPVSNVRTVQFGPAEPFFPSLCCIYRGDEQSQRKALFWPRGKKQWNMTHITNKPIPFPATVW